MYYYDDDDDYDDGDVDDGDEDGNDNDDGGDDGDEDGDRDMMMMMNIIKMSYFDLQTNDWKKFWLDGVLYGGCLEKAKS